MSKAVNVTNRTGEYFATTSPFMYVGPNHRKSTRENPEIIEARRTDLRIRPFKILSMTSMPIVCGLTPELSRADLRRRQGHNLTRLCRRREAVSA